jgi:RHS repeat-associated protein
LTNLEYLGDSDEDDILNASFEYDGSGIRTKAVEGDVVTRYYHDGLNVLFEKDALGFTKKAYTRALGFPGGIGGLISMKRYETEEDDGEEETEEEATEPKASYYHYDALGSVRGLSDENGKLKHDFDYDAFGNGKSNKQWNTYRFSSKEFESHAGLYYFGARYYDPEIGRWLTPDPLGFIDGPNKYLYVGNNPVNFVDPLGLKEWIYVSTSLGGGLGIAAAEGGEYYLIDPDTGEYYKWTFLSGGIGIGFGGAVQIEVGGFDWQGDPTTIPNWSWTVSGFSAAKYGVAGQFTSPTGNQPLDLTATGNIGATAGFAGGVGIGISAMRSRSWFQEKGYILPDKLREVVEGFKGSQYHKEVK